MNMNLTWKSRKELSLKVCTLKELVDFFSVTGTHVLHLRIHGNKIPISCLDR